MYRSGLRVSFLTFPLFLLALISFLSLFSDPFPGWYIFAFQERRPVIVTSLCPSEAYEIPLLLLTATVGLIRLFPLRALAEASRAASDQAIYLPPLAISIPL